jgi:DNA-binding beta-propeller fold protein YncE
MAIPLPDGQAGIGFDDLHFSPALHQVLAPAGRTGNVALVDPMTLTATTIGGFSSGLFYVGGHDEGPTSADAGDGRLYVTDRSTQLVHIVDVAAQTIVGSAHLAASPDYIRFVAATHEVWVTEPDSEQVEIFSVADKTQPVHVGSVAVAGGPESLVIDSSTGRAYTHLWGGATVGIDVQQRSIVTRFANGCANSRGIAIEESSGILFAGCLEGKVVALDTTQQGRQLGSASSGDGVDIIDFSPTLRHVYLPGASSATMAIIGVGTGGALSVLGTSPTVPEAHCVAADDQAHAYLCDLQNGRLLVYNDPFPRSAP